MLSSIRNLDYTVIICADVEAMKRFYRDALGFRIVRDFGTWVEFQVGATLLTLRQRATGYDGVRDHDGPASGSGASLQLAFRVSPAAVDGCFSELRQREVTIVQPPTLHPETGHRTLFLKDVENNILEIFSEE